MNRAWLTAAVLCALATPAPALACGGFFCSSAPIDQAGETIVYGLEDDGTLTMAVQIRYSGDDDDFAWILPVVAPPEISLGSEALFDSLHAATRPTFGVESVTEGTCRPHPTCVREGSCATIYDSGCGGGAPSSGGGWMGGFVDAATPPPVADASASADAGPPDEGVTVFSRGAVGPYESVVLGAATAREVVDWLHAHDYDVPDTSVPLLETYAAAGQVFVALRLSSNARTRQIRPVVLRMPTDEACLPIRLTAIATVPDMPITAFFLGREQVRSANYNTAMVDAERIGFFDGSLSYAAEVTREVDALGGQALVTEYAGPTPALALELPPVGDLATETDPSAYIGALADRGYRGDPQLRELLEDYLIPPAGRAATTYYNCLFTGSTRSCGEPEAFDPAGLSEAIAANITAPRREAEALVHRHGYLTRLFTTMSAEDMTIDPVFVTDGELPDQSNVHVAQRVTECSRSYYREEAPEHWLLDGVETTISTGTLADDRAYCADRGGVPIDEAEECSDPPERSGGCLCMAAGTAPMQGGLLFGVALILLGRRSWRRR